MVSEEKHKNAIRMLLLLIEHKTKLPESAANGVIAPDGTDEGKHRAAEIIYEARSLLEEEWETVCCLNCIHWESDEHCKSTKPDDYHKPCGDYVGKTNEVG